MTRPKAWADLDQDVRRAVRRGTYAPAHGRLTGVHGPGRRGRWDRAVDRVRLALAPCDPGGRIREATLPYAAERPELLPLIVVRTTDWVAPVRARAPEVLRESTAHPRGRRRASAVAGLRLRLRLRLRLLDAVRLGRMTVLPGDPAPVVVRAAERALFG
ncbi:hypothetical protein [Streptomyces hydrogenans]|uniref:hypothetical protein n=1 Tax=Streptomyces hydrogenans TaxID=1873719 RepID=UPI00167D22BF|nr:hypothetical protein [Streptomyces hydrogenans]